MISKKVYQELISVRRAQQYLPVSPTTETGWAPHERELFWMALDRFPRGPWAAIADLIGTKSSRQVMTHAQKLRQKLKRWVTRLRCNSNARSLMDGIAIATSTNVSATPELSLAISVSRSETAALTELSEHANASTLTKSEVSLQSAQCEGEDNMPDILKSDPRLRQHKNCKPAAKTSSDPVATRVCSEGGGTPSIESITCNSSALQLLFEPQAVISSTSTPAAMGSGETTYGTITAVTCLTNESSISARLLDELADELWGDQLDENK